MENKNTPSKTNWFIQPMVVSIFLAGGFMLGVWFQGEGKSTLVQSEHSSAYHKLGEILNFVQTRYVDTVDIDRLADVAAEAILNELDPHSYYIPQEKSAAITNRMQGNLEGIGVEFFLFLDTVYVVDVIANSPASKVDLLPGDAILAINDTLVSGLEREMSEIVELFRGPVDSEVRLRTLRNAEEKEREVVVKRGTVPINSVGSSYLIEEDLLYLKLNSFTARSYSEFMQVIEENVAGKEKIDLILDLRHNPGGYLQEAIKILSQLFPQAGKTMVKTKSHSKMEKTYRSNGRNFFHIDRVVVLIDGASASASEIVAGVVQDLDRGLVIGSKSFGKGSVQEHYRLRDNSAIRLTVSKYYIPSGRAIFREEDWVADNGGATDEEASFYTTNGRLVPEGKAIQPDILVDVNSMFSHADFNKYLQFINQLAFSYFRDEAGQIQEYSAEYLNQLIPQTWQTDLLELLEEEDGKRDLENLLEENSERVYSFLEARLGRFIFGSNLYYEVLNRTDPVVRTAIEALESDYQAMLSRQR